MPALITLLDILAIATALLASWLWYLAGHRHLRRVSRFEHLDHADLNRLIVAMNRTSILNRRAALASSASAAFVALRFAASYLGGM